MTTSTDFEESLLDLFAGIEEDNLTDLSDFADNFLTQGENGGGSDGETSSSSGSSIVSLHHDRDHQLHPHYNSYHHHNNNNNNNNNPSPTMMTAMPPVLMPCYDFDSNNLYLHSNATAPLLSKSNKRVKKEVDESRLIKNRESANRSRMKRKNEKSEMEDTIVELKNRIRSLELENTALVTDNASLHNQNLYLRSLLSEREREMDTKKTHPIPTLNGTVSGITVFCLVCMCTVFNDWLPPAIRVTQGLTSSIAKVSSSSHHHHPSGRVLLSMNETPTIHMTSPYSDAIESTPQSYLRMGLLVVAVLCYFGYHQYLQRKNLQRNGYVLP